MERKEEGHITFSLHAAARQHFMKGVVRGQGSIYQVFVQVGHLLLQFGGFDVRVRHPHHHDAPAQLVREVDAFAHLASDDREKQRPRERAAVHSTPLAEITRGVFKKKKKIRLNNCDL